MILIDGVRYDVGIANIRIKGDVLDKYGERNDAGTLLREPIGSYYNYTVDFVPIRDPVLHNLFYSDLTAPKEYRTVTLPGEFATYTFQCYITTEEVAMRHHKDTGNTYEGIKARFIAVSPARRP